jgi:hypothetical protein
MLRPQRAFQVRVYRVESQGAQFGIEMPGRGRFSMVDGLIESVLSHYNYCGMKFATTTRKERRNQRVSKKLTLP